VLEQATHGVHTIEGRGPHERRTTVRPGVDVQAFDSYRL
jgi:hypothetical protein